MPYVYYPFLQIELFHGGLFRGVIEGRVSPVSLRNIGICLTETKPVSSCNQNRGHDLAVSPNVVGTDNDFGQITRFDIACHVYVCMCVCFSAHDPYPCFGYFENSKKVGCAILGCANKGLNRTPYMF